ncbi:MAG TPA: TolC family protein [Dinghuibacter sp.]|uniref:TolC family protein n=1 Tax=Dinghuibacter sp. TaxID=2024697 RepID=UPI002B7E217E|nr:TolC family protein [Dinghuibacter sp.]HTJ13448.1 TolC family protein [Dinghuibacter sp.]
MRRTLLLLLLLGPLGLAAQDTAIVLTLPRALGIARANYAGLREKRAYAEASARELQADRRDGLPDATLGIEQAFGTLNGLNGLSSGQPGLTTLTNGPVVTTQNWNAAFGALYVSNIDWNIYSFGLQRAHVAVGAAQYRQDQEDLRQSVFQQEVRVAGAYLSLLAAQRVRMAMEDNLARALDLREVILARTLNGLNPGVDSSIADAEVSQARLSLIDAQNYEDVRANELATGMGVAPQKFALDTSFSLGLPPDTLGAVADVSGNPVLQFLSARIGTSDKLAGYIHKSGLPRISLFGVGQERGSGFGSNYSNDPGDVSSDYLQGVNPYRTNYLLGIGLTWNLTGLSRVKARTAAQRFRSEALASDYDLAQSKLLNQLALSDRQIGHALARYRETPVQLRSASDAYGQKKALYENGLNTIVDVTQTLYLLNRAEIDRDIACNAVWQAILFKAGTAGDLNLFLKQL